MLLQTAVQQQLHQAIPPDQKESLSELQHAIDHNSVDVYLRNNFTVDELVDICHICHLRPPSHEKEVLVNHIVRNMIKKNQHSILEIIEYVLSSANMTYHILGNALTGLTVILSSGVMFTMLKKLFTVGSSSDTVDTSLSDNCTKSAGICFLLSLIFIASKNITLPTLRMNMNAHRNALKDQKEVFHDTQDSISKHRRLRENLKKTKRTSRVKRLSYAIHEVKNNKKRHQINNFSKSKKHKSFRRRIPRGLFSRKR